MINKTGAFFILVLIATFVVNLLMKKFLPLLLTIVVSTGSFGQITITNADFAAAGDTARFSTASASSPVDVTLTGANYTWDFSFLQPTSQGIDTFLSVTSTPIIYAFTFGFNSNVAKKGFANGGLPGVPVSDVYNFYNRSTNNYRQTGYGGSLNGITTPLSFNSPDIIYDFPVNFGNIDSSDSDYSLAVPNVATAVGNQRRVNVVDGWGSITTPYGTFNALRIKSTLTGEDSLYLDSIGQGFSIPRALTREYKWLAAGQDIPLLEIVTRELQPGTESVASIRYKDIARSVGLATVSLLANDPLLRPNPSGANDVHATINLRKATDVSLLIQSMDGRTVEQKILQLNAGIQNVLVKPAAQSLQAGVYLVTFVVDNERYTTKMIVE